MELTESKGGWAFTKVLPPEDYLRFMAKNIRQERNSLLATVSITVHYGANGHTRAVKLAYDTFPIARDPQRYQLARSAHGNALLDDTLKKEYTFDLLKHDLDLFCQAVTDKTDITDKVDNDGSELTQLTNADKCQSTDKRIWKLVDQWLIYHKGERFELESICRELEITGREDRHSIVKKLHYLVRNNTLEKKDRFYTCIDHEVKPVEWWKHTIAPSLPIEWPRGVDGTKFGFDGHAVISPGNIIVLAGASNAGKSAWCMNFLWANMDKFPCLMMGNEFGDGSQFYRRVCNMPGGDPMKEDGTPKFELIERFNRWHDVVKPDHINIIDWIELGDAFYQIGTIIQEIKSKLKGGIAVIAIQKESGKALGMGGGFSKHLASVYLTIDHGRLYVEKCKEWYDRDPNFETYAFRLDRGTQFSNIRRVKPCLKCKGSGLSFKGDGSCPICFGKGYTET